MPAAICAIDTHCHAFPDFLAERAVALNEQRCGSKAVGDGTCKGLLGSMAAAGISKALVCMIATRVGQEDNILSFCCQLQSDRLKPLASVHPDTPEAAKYIERIAEAGLTGIKIHSMYQNCPLDDARMDPIFAAASANGLLITAHCGRDIAFGEDNRASPERIARILNRHRKVKFLATHLGGWQNWEDARRHLLDAKMYLECSFSLQYLSAEQAEVLIRDFGVERVMLGTDWPWADQSQTIGQIRRLGFSAAEQKAILQGNASRVLGIQQAKH